ncbi:hypothetical protein [Pseudoclavibacter sp. Z016]|uniref:hypothetical protein n=1 Tax=Pseudoclavibacter sp. Z016 TaxID=2080581 RepID=UPI000CE804CF|nr:hypothetical protein [Pseudoclavibacter sp. Z016]PPF75507.1 hypothetical protein C5B99_06225 [Pseudoclavibacter sp. Z016]
MSVDSRTWWEDDPARLEQEIADVRAVAPLLTWTEEEAGWFEGPLPLWPFARSAPANISDLLDPFVVRVEYNHAFPAAPPHILPLLPQPVPTIRGFTQFHVLPSGRLCLLRDADQWYPWSKTSELLLKASGWAIEFALFEAGAITRMSMSGIVIDTSHDELIAEQIETLTS